MKSRSLLLIMCLFVGLKATAQTPGWTTASSNYRLALEKNKEARWPADVGHATVWPVGLDPRNCVVTVNTEEGKPVGSQVLFAAPGAPLKIIFDTTGRQTRYLVYLSAQPNLFPISWKPPEAGCLLEVREYTGSPIETVAQVKQAWKQAPHLQGRGYVPNIFHGINPFGPSENFIAQFRGQFIAPKDGEYRFATISDDASVLTIDGKDVADWCGSHGANPHAYEQHSGKIKLTAGPHLIDYLWVQGSQGLTAVAAWKLPDTNRYAVLPAEAFTPVAQFDVVAAESGPESRQFTYFECQEVNHSTAENLSLVEVRFRVVSAQSNLTYRWNFDDNATARGAEVQHLFLRPALRSVKLEVVDGGRVVFTITQKVDVHPRWEQRNEWTDERFAGHRKQITGLNFSKLPVADLANVTRLAAAINDQELLTGLGQACLARTREFTGEYTDIFYALGGHFQDPDVRLYEPAEQALRAALALKSRDANLHERVKLRLARLLLDTAGKSEETGKLLKDIKADSLNDEQRRMLAILRADLLLARGDVEAARGKYEAINRLGERDRGRYSIIRQSRLESARSFLARREYAAAENLVRTVEWEVPVERLAPEFSLVLAKVYMARQEFPSALLRCQRLLAVTNNDNLRAEVLFNLVEVERAMKLDQLAEKTLQQLLTQHPYSESAALAKERWGKR